MMRSWLMLLGFAGLVACEPGDDDDVDQAPTVDAAGAYVGDVSVQTDVPENFIISSAEIVIAEDGSVSGNITTKAPTATVGEVGSVSGTISLADVASYDAELLLELPTLGTFTAAGSLAYGESSGQLAGQLSARDHKGALVGSTIVSVHQE